MRQLFSKYKEEISEGQREASHFLGVTVKRDAGTSMNQHNV